MTVPSDFLFVVPARKGSKGIPGKNTKALGGKPLINYSLELLLSWVPKEQIFVSTDDENVVALAESCGIAVPELRPAELSNDTAGMQDVLKYTLKRESESGRDYRAVVLLQPTSPFRNLEDLKGCVKAYEDHMDMLVSMRLSHDNPYFNLYEENESGFLTKSKSGVYVRRQDCPKAWKIDGSLYVFNAHSIQQKPVAEFERIAKFESSSKLDVDLDTPEDWDYAEYLLSKQ